MSEHVELEKITIELDLHFRDGVNIEVVSRYVEVWDRLPPVKCIRLDDGTLLLASGLHRLHAYKKVGETMIPADITDGTRHDAMVIGLKDNVLHGLPLSREERNRAIVQLARDGMTYPTIGEIFSLHDTTINKIANAEGERKRPKSIGEKGHQTRNTAANPEQNFSATDFVADIDDNAETSTPEPEGGQTEPTKDAAPTAPLPPDNADTHITENEVTPVANVVEQTTPEEELELPLQESLEEISASKKDRPLLVDLGINQWKALVRCAQQADLYKEDAVAQSAVETIKMKYTTAFRVPWCDDE